MTGENEQWILVERAAGPLRTDLFERRSVQLTPLRDGETRVSVNLLSLDPVVRVMIGPPSPDKDQPYVAPGEVMFGFGIGEVIETCDPEFAVGDLIEGRLGWQRIATVSKGHIRKRNPQHALDHLLSVLGISGMTAYYGMIDILNVQPGETVVVSSAAGGVGSIAGQIAKLRGCRVIGIAGGASKCDWLINTLGYDDALDYKSGDLDAQLERACGEGIDVFFDNVGGEILQSVALMMKKRGRIGLCGALGVYNDEAIHAGLRRLSVTLILKELHVMGFSVVHFVDGWDAAEAQLVDWLQSGKLKAPMERREGFDRLPDHFMALFRGENMGKMIVKL